MDKAVPKLKYQLDDKGHIFVELKGAGQHDYVNEQLVDGEIGQDEYKIFVDKMRHRYKEPTPGATTKQIFEELQGIAREIRRGK